MIGATLGPYRILEKIGEGGMGEVYRAHDTALGRDVALKVLPQAFVSSADRAARFEREARLLASLSHPNIAAIYGLERAGDSNVLVLEMVPGQTLADRIAAGALTLHDTLTIARQIADALAAAHDKGIVHRDLKPANIKVTADDQVKVLDFGLAKMIDADESARGDGASGLSRSPTLTTPAMTGIGMVLGTAAYMAPEQARGKPVDKRADIWAFGCVLYEMLAGARPFVAGEVSDTLALILTKEIDWAALPASTPLSIRRLLRRCLEKDRARRLADIADARFDIDEALAPGSAEAGEAGAPASAKRMLGSRLGWIAAAVALIIAAATLVWRPAAAPASTAAAAVRVRADLGIGRALMYPTRDLVISPDGSRLAFVAGAPTDIVELSKSAAQNETPKLYVRSLDQLQASAIPGTEGAAWPFFSPDGRWIAFFADRKLKKVSTGGGAVVTLCDAPSGGGGSWRADGTIVFQARTFLGEPDSLSQIGERGGVPSPLVQARGQHVPVRWPQMLPGGRGVLATAPASTSTFNDANIVVVSVPSGERKSIQRGYHGRYLPTGQLTFVRDGTLFAQPFDVDRLEVTGSAVPVVQDVRVGAMVGSAEYSISDQGTLVYLAARSGTVVERPAYWLDRTGKTSPLIANARTWGTPRFSPDGRRVAFTIMDDAQQNADIWVYEWERDTMVRLTRGPEADVVPIWSPDGKWIAYGSITNEGTASIANLFARRSDGSGEAIRLTKSPEAQLPDAWHPSGKFIAFHQGAPQTGQQAIWTLPVEADGDVLKAGTPSEFVKGPFLASMASFSPDGRWMAYVTNESGVFDVYVRPFPGPGGRWQISSGGGNTPRWSANRRELIFTTLQQQAQLRVVPYTVAGDTFQAGRASPWSGTTIGIPPFAAFGIPWDLHPDGDRAAVSLPTNAPAFVDDDRAVVVFNFFDELRRLAPPKK